MASTSSSGKVFEAILPKSLPLSASSSSTSSTVYDVFLNHRGTDFEEGIAKDLYDALKHKGLRVFLDRKEFEIGTYIPDELENAIRSVSVCIAVFSPGYAESPWCLEELSFMVKIRTTIIPIFDGVKPSDLRWGAEGKGDYASAFSQHEKKRSSENKPRYTQQKLEEWKGALSHVSLIYGHELKKDEDRPFESIVDSVFKKMKVQFLPLEVAQQPVGLDETVKDFEKSAYHEQDVNIVGILGMGGIGKTTLAKALYNRKCFNIFRRSFISDVRDVAAKSNLHELQKQLLQDLLLSERFKSSIHNITQGKAILREYLSSLRVLIVLDDVDHVDQIDALLPEKGIFAEGSLIIVTTRESNVLQPPYISCIYKMKTLTRVHAKQLFCWHAFMQSDPDQEFEDLVQKAMNVCQSLPLSLKVLGGQLYGKSKVYWVSQLDKISRILPQDITKRLKISFEALDKEDKSMFLDAACFFLGEGKSLAIEVWDGSGWSGLLGWETLLSKCLVELDQQNRIRMHDHLRDMGRQIAMEGPPYRLFPSSNLDIWTRGQERMVIRGIMESSIDRLRNRPALDYRPLFKEYIELKPSSPGVQLLVAVNNVFYEEYAMLSKELRWLRLFNLQSRLPSWLSLENLRVLELYNAGNIGELWEDDMKQLPLQLRELIIDCRNADRGLERFPSSIGLLRHLKKLSLSGPGSFQNLPEELCNLQSLEHLELTCQYALSSLPRRFGNLTNLKHLDLSHCRNLEMLPDSFKQLRHLQYFNVEECRNLSFDDTDIFENITKLEYLNFKKCYKLYVLPHHITKQAFLSELNLENTSLRELPSNIGQLERLEVLQIGCSSKGGSGGLKSLPDSLGNLRSLTKLSIISCWKLRSLPESLGRLALLKFIEIWDTRVKSLPKAFGSLVSLRTLSISYSPIRELFSEFEESSSLPRLKSIHLEITEMSTLSISEDFCPSLESLSLLNNDSLLEIRTLPRTVKTLTVRYCTSLKDIAGRLRNLQRLIIRGCPKLAELPSFAECTSTKEIEIKGCESLGKIEGLEKLTSLEIVTVHTKWEVAGITSLEQAQRLRRLRLSADNIGALEPCIKTLQKWPGQLMVCARALGDMKSVVKAFTSSKLEVKKGHTPAGARYPKSCLSHEATIICFVRNCSKYGTVFTEHISEGYMKHYKGKEDKEMPTWHLFSESDNYSQIELREGKWVWIVVVSHSSSHVESGWRIYSELEMWLMATGEEKVVKDVFYQVLNSLKM